MIYNEVVDWSHLSSDELTEAAVRARHQPAEHFRVSPYRYEPNERFDGTTRAGLCYVVKGRLTLTNSSGSFELKQGQVLFFSSGNYEVKVTSSTTTEVVYVWELPPIVWPDNQP